MWYCSYTMKTLFQNLTPKPSLVSLEGLPFPNLSSRDKINASLVGWIVGIIGENVNIKDHS